MTKKKSIFPAVILTVVGLWLGFDVLVKFTAENLWFQTVGYAQVFSLLLMMRSILLIVGLGVSSGFLLGNLLLAKQLKYDGPIVPLPGAPAPTSPLTLRWLLPIVLILGLVLGTIVFYYSQIALTYWWAPAAEPSGLQSIGTEAGLSPLPLKVPQALGWDELGRLLRQIQSQPYLLVVVLVVAIACTVQQRFLIAGAVLLLIGNAYILSAHWAQVLLFLHPTAFNISDPLFNQDISFYIFALPLWKLLEFWLKGIFLFAFAAVGLIYLTSGNSLSEGIFPGFSPGQRRHLNGLGGGFMLLVAGGYWLDCYELLYSTRGVSYGAGFTDVNVQLPVDIILALSALAISINLLSKAIVSSSDLKNRQSQSRSDSRIAPDDSRIAPTAKKSQRLPPFKPSYLPTLRTLLLFYLGLMLAADYFLPTVVQRLVVQPSELEREQPYLQRSIAFTRQAFGLDNIEAYPFDPEGKLNRADIQNNDLTIGNIRLWDSRPLLQTNRQLQQIRPYYQFPDADIDRYTLKTESPRPNQPQTEKQQVLIAARELDFTSITPAAQTWVNQHLVYTHGYGFTLSPVNMAGPEGLPYYFVKDISGDTAGTLNTSEDRIRASIPISHPRIYYGEIANTYVMAPSKVPELDYPKGEDNAYHNYSGAGGVPLSNWWRRLVFAKYLKSWQMLFTNNLTPETKVLYRRNIKQRITSIAPFLHYDKDPYLVVANAKLQDRGQPPTPIAQNYLYWIVDAYTTSQYYPYSEPSEDQFNYIRNSVKVVIDAYNGLVDFYVADPTDPIIQSWQAIFPGMFQPLEAMPASLRSHIRYPVDLFEIQSERLLDYHMTDPQVFYNREDQWQVPQEIYGSEPRPVAPYYLIFKLPAFADEEFILLHPFTPTRRNNLIGWLAGRSDGNNYGKLLLYQFPKQRLIYGPEQIEARINQDPDISQQISLWNRQGSRVIQGNLLVIPIEKSLLYVEPLYLEAEQNSLPTLARVIVAYENRIVMAGTLTEALNTLFQPQPRDN
ncbi:MAG TPA: UPF0182 family protein [Oscillatoriaceae cyanobacterium M33_DOE_052]|uniref:UPF0182 protein ENR15_06780 n=1 Tax=Planktothricoides sp. SpSt-374 TaxID=2282167 RepID=A0A7C3ZUN2_9CYAN|nr:UPF0182 family protein [Oscillatoriaceae cyanobacterium M33_DOE_052]